MIGIESPAGDSSQMVFKRQADGTEMAGWCVAVVSPDKFVRIRCGHVVHWEPCLAGTTPQNSLVWLKLFVGLILSFLAVLVCAYYLIPNTWLVSRLVLRKVKGTSQ